ncbi:MAG TPA: undecaprenyl/decaprenyl-phosphate alpha-N-acetylglucosaminyl 1-phosphate transferase [Acidimicrobiaceae bacterium]|nr:undecaprenyl/decaprenyl-phosphate alpha-N-acetylglucosaminyl 1-phosphate transferase [Acidimicrobiaceae bacterium]
MPSTAAYLLVGAVAAVATFVTTPIVVRIARRMGWVVAPDERRVHTVTTPDVGGIAMVVGFVFALGVARLLDAFDPVFARSSEPQGVLIAAVLMFLVGFIDDIREISAPAKVAGTMLVAVVLVYYGVTMFYFRVPFLDVFLLSDDWVPLVTAVWLLGMTMAINLIDGLDGLAAGIVAIGAGAFFLYSQRLADPAVGMLSQPNIGPLVAILTAGICIGFLPHNFNPAKIFMGDGGALLLGLLMAVSTSVVGGRADPNTDRFVGQTYFFLAPLFIPLFILGVPILDTLWAIVRRAAKRQGVASADKGHLHHRLMEMGHGQRRSVLILWAWTGLLSAFVLYPVFTGSGVSYIPIGAAMLGLLLYTVLHPQIRRRRS